MTITDQPMTARGWATSAAIAVSAWFLALALLTVALEPSPTVAVFGPVRRVAAALDGTEMRIVGAGTGYLIVRGSSPGFVRTLYEHGAWLILPSDITGCLALTRPPKT
jgi:hypothetical protein